MTDRPVVRRGSPTDAAGVAALHAAELPDGFLVSLGERFLVRLYRRIAVFDGSFLLVAGAPGQPEGFIAVAEGTGRLYKEFLRRDAVAAGLTALPAVLRAPRHTWETYKYGQAEPETTDLPSAEILSVAVAPAARGKGLGRGLVESAVVELRERDIGGVRVVTAADNEAGLRMYEGAGFTRRATTQVHKGVDQVVLAWS